MTRYRYTTEDKDALEFCNSVRVLLDKKPVKRMGRSVEETIGNVRICRVRPEVYSLALSLWFIDIPLAVDLWMLYSRFNKGDTHA